MTGARCDQASLLDRLVLTLAQLGLLLLRTQASGQPAAQPPVAMGGSPRLLLRRTGVDPRRPDPPGGRWSPTRPPSRGPHRPG